MNEHRNPLTVKSFIRDREEMLELTQTVSLAADWVGSTDFQEHSSAEMRQRLVKLGCYLSDAIWKARYE